MLAVTLAAVVLVLDLALVGGTHFNSNGLGYSGDFHGRPLGTRVSMTGFNTFPAGVGTVSFREGIFDGTYVWLIPYDADGVLRVLPSDASMTLYQPFPTGTTTTNAFFGGAFDGTFLWMCPFDANGVVRVEVANGAMVKYTSFPAGQTSIGDFAFAGATIALGKVWMSPWKSNQIARVDTSNGAMDAHGLTLAATDIRGFVSDGTYVWLVPCNIDRVYRVDPTDDSTVSYTGFPAGVTATGSQKFAGGAYDGTYVWLAPQSANRVVRVHAGTGVMSSFSGWPAGATIGGSAAYRGGFFDGEAFWLNPSNAVSIVRVDVETGLMSQYNNWPSGCTCGGGFLHQGSVFDGQNLWIVPLGSSTLVRVSPDTTTPTPTATDPIKDTRTLTPTPTAAETRTNTFSPTSSATASLTLPPTRTATSSLVATPSGTHSPSASLMATPTATIPRTPTATDTSTNSLTQTPTATFTPGPTRTLSATQPPPPTLTEPVTASSTGSRSESVPPTSTVTESPSPSSSGSQTASETLSPPPTLTPTSSITPSRSFTRSITTSISPPPTPTPTASASMLATSTATITSTVSLPLTPTATIQPPIPFEAAMAISGALFAGAVNVVMSYTLVLDFKSTNHRGAALADYAMNLTCVNASVALPPVSSATNLADAPSPSFAGSATLALGLSSSLPDGFRTSEDSCVLSICAAILRSCASSSFKIPVEYPELAVSVNLTASGVISVTLGLNGRVPAEAVTIEAAVVSLTGVKMNLTADSRCSWNGTCVIGDMQPGVQLSLTDGELIIPSYYQGDVAIVVAARAENTDAVAYTRLLFDSSTRTVNASESHVNASGVWVMFEVSERVLNVTSLPLPPNHEAAFITPAPLNFLTASIHGISGGEDVGGVGGIHFVIITTAAFGLVLLVGRLAALRSHKSQAAIPPLEEQPLYQLVLQQHLWVSVCYPCHYRCISVHATELFVAVLACYAACCGCISAVGDGWPASSKVALAAAMGAFAMCAARAVLRVLFNAYRVPELVSFASGRSNLRQVRKKRELKKSSMRHRSRAATMANSELLSPTFSAFEEGDAFAVPYLELNATFHNNLRPLGAEDEEAVQGGDADEVRMELPDAIFPEFNALTGSGLMESGELKEREKKQEQFASLDLMAFDDGDDDFNIDSGVADPSGEGSGSPGSGEPWKPFASSSPKQELPYTESTTATGLGMSDTPFGTDATPGGMPLIVVDVDGTGNPGAFQDIPLPPVLSPSVAEVPPPDGGRPDSSSWHVDRLTAANVLSSPISSGGGGGTIGRLQNNFTTGRSASPVDSIMTRTNSFSSLGSDGERRNELYSTGAPLAVPDAQDEAPLTLTLGRYRQIGYALSAALAVVLACVTFALSGQWRPDDKNSFWVAVYAAFAINALVLELVVLLLSAFQRWFVDNLPSDQRTFAELFRARHPYEGEVVDCANRKAHQPAAASPEELTEEQSLSGGARTTTVVSSSLPGSPNPSRAGSPKSVKSSSSRSARRRSVVIEEDSNRAD